MLLDDDVSIEEVEKMKIELEGKVNSLEPSTGGYPKTKESFRDEEAEVLKQLANYVEELLVRDYSVGESDIFEENSEFEEAKIEVVIDNSETKNDIEVLKSIKRKSKNSNPLLKSVPVLKKSKVKSTKSLKEVETEVDKDFQDLTVEYPDDPTFREVKHEERVRRDETEAEVVFGDKFRKYKDDREGGFRKQGGVEDNANE